MAYHLLKERFLCYNFLPIGCHNAVNSGISIADNPFTLTLSRGTAKQRSLCTQAGIRWTTPSRLLIMHLALALESWFETPARFEREKRETKEVTASLAVIAVHARAAISCSHQRECGGRLHIASTATSTLSFFRTSKTPNSSWLAVILFELRKASPIRLFELRKSGHQL